MILAVFAGSLFMALLFLGMAIYAFVTRSKVVEMLAGAPESKDTAPFFESLWDFTKAGLAFDDALKIGCLSSALLVACGFILQGVPTAVIGGIIGFVLGPRVYTRIKRKRFQNKFEAQFARAMSAFAAAAQVMPLGLCFRHVAEEFSSPTKEVFSYIQSGIEKLNYQPHDAIQKASRDFELPILADLAEAIRVLDELGGGEHAIELLDAVAEEARFNQRHKLEVKSTFGEIKYSMIAACVVPVFIFFLFLADKGSDFALAVSQYPWLIVCGFVFLVIGWIFASRLIAKASETI
jgi:Flp pilus assembly protein TadB